MFRILKRYSSAVICVTCAFVGWRALAFTPDGPIGGGTDAYQTLANGYGLTTNGFAELVAPKALGEEYRFITPNLSYAFSQTFFEFFGTDGAAAVDQAFAILNAALSNGVSSWSPNLDEFPLDSSRINYRASALGLIDLKSQVLSIMLEEVGLADSVHYVWNIRDARPIAPGAPNCLYEVVQRNFDPVTFEPTAYVNGILYTYDIFPARCNTGANPQQDAREIPVDAEASANAPVSSGIAAFASGGYYTGLTRDDAGGFRYLLRPSNVNFEPPPDNSVLLSGGGTGLTNGTPQILTTLNLDTLLQEAATNNAAQLQALNPGLLIASSTTNFFLQVTTNIVVTFTNLPTAPVGSAATLVVRTVLTTNFGFSYHHTFSNVVTNRFSPLTWAAKQTITVTTPPTAPVGSTALVTNVSGGTPVLVNRPSGEYYLLPANVCGYAMILAITNVTPATNILLQVNAATAGVANVGGQSYTLQEVTWFTNTTMLVYAINCTTTAGAASNTAPQLQGGMNSMQFRRVNYDSLIGRTLVPITNRFTLPMVTNSTVSTQTWERVTTTPDILFTINDLLDGIIARTAPNFTQDPAGAGGGLAGPGTIAAPITITFNKNSQQLINIGPFFLHEAEASFFFHYGSFDGTTNDPIVFPSGLSISNLEYQVTHPPPP